MKENILNTIRQIRKEKNITQEQMANLLGMKTNTYGDIEKNNTRIRLEDFLQICKILNIDPISLVKNTDEIIISLSKDEIEALSSIQDKINSQIKEDNSIRIGNNNTIKNSFNKR